MKNNLPIGWREFLLLFALTLWVGCGGKKPSLVSPPRTFPGIQVQDKLNSLVPSSFSETQILPIFFATNRVPGKSQGFCDDASFGVQRSVHMSFGICQVSVPKNHSVGNLPTTSENQLNLHQHFKISAQISQTQDSWVTWIQEKKPTDVLVFVHGFNVKFQEAVFRAAQLAYDLRFPGPVVLFSWPAGAPPGSFEKVLLSKTYDFNQESASHSIVQTAQFFKFLFSQGVMLHLIVHSMGHQVVLPALALVNKEISIPFIGELFLHAPDISSEIFLQLAPTLQTLAQRVTLYCSNKDSALVASEKWNETRRVGHCERVPGVDVINVGEIQQSPLGIGLGHGYYSSREIVTDMFQALLGIRPEKRLFVRSSNSQGSENYFLRP